MFRRSLGVLLKRDFLFLAPMMMYNGLLYASVVKHASGV
jgi:hypothetical protein